MHSAAIGCFIEQAIEGTHVQTVEQLDGQLSQRKKLKLATSLSTVCEWVVEAWNTIPAEMVMKSFLKCGILNSPDGSEDNALFDEYVLSTNSPCN